MKTAYSKTFGFGLILLLLVHSLGCMVSPGNQQVFASRSTLIPFSGFTVYSSQKVEIFARDPVGLAWVKIGETYSDDNSVEYFDAKWYFWKKEVAVPKKLWQQWGKDGGYFVLLKAVADKNELVAFEEGFYDYYEDYGSLEDLYFENASPGGAEILVWAEQ